MYFLTINSKNRLSDFPQVESEPNNSNPTRKAEQDDLRISILNAFGYGASKSLDFGSDCVTLARSTSSKFDFKSLASSVQTKLKEETRKLSGKSFIITAEQLSTVEDICIQIETEESYTESIRVTIAKSLSNFNHLLS